jgi:hypothetical protein
MMFRATHAGESGYTLPARCTPMCTPASIIHNRESDQATAQRSLQMRVELGHCSSFALYRVRGECSKTEFLACCRKQFRKVKS